MHTDSGDLSLSHFFLDSAFTLSNSKQFNKLAKIILSNKALMQSFIPNRNVKI